MDEIKAAIEDVVIEVQTYYESRETIDSEYVAALLECITALQWINDHERRMYKLTIRLMGLKEAYSHKARAVLPDDHPNAM